MAKPLMIVVGDSRVKWLQQAAGHSWLNHWKVKWISGKGNSLEMSMRKLKQHRDDHESEIPEMVVILSILCDIVKQVKNEDGSKNYILNPMVNGRDYPGLPGFAEHIGRMDGTIQGWWPDALIIWILPFPIDIYRWTILDNNKSRKLTQDEITACHGVTFQIGKYLEEANKKGTRIPRFGDRFIPWYPSWIRMDKNKSYQRFMDSTEIPSFHINPAGSKDGLHPSNICCDKFLNILKGKANVKILPPKEHHAPKLPAWCTIKHPVNEATSAKPILLEQSVESEISSIENLLTPEGLTDEINKIKIENTDIQEGAVALEPKSHQSTSTNRTFTSHLILHCPCGHYIESLGDPSLYDLIRCSSCNYMWSPIDKTYTKLINNQINVYSLTKVNIIPCGQTQVAPKIYSGPWN